jgi:hypothetical protein
MEATARVCNTSGAPLRLSRLYARRHAVASRAAVLTNSCTPTSLSRLKLDSTTPFSTPDSVSLSCSVTCAAAAASETLTSYTHPTRE